MSYFKIIVLIYLLCPFFLYSEFGSTDSSNLNSLKNSVNVIQSHTSGINQDVNTIATLLENNEYLFQNAVNNIQYIQNDIRDNLWKLGTITDLLYIFEGELDRINFGNTQSDSEGFWYQGLYGIQKNLWRVTKEEDGQHYLVVSNIAPISVSVVVTNPVSSDDEYGDEPLPPYGPLDLSILTNHILGAAYLNPELGWGDYYEFFENYQNEEFDAEIFIAEMGLHNWYIGLLFGDWWVNIPDGWDDEEDYENRWGLVDEAQLFWSPLVESSAFQPYEISNAKFFLYGTREITDRFNDFMNFVETNAVSQAQDSTLGDPTTIEALDNVPEDIIPTENDNQTGPIDEILSTDVENDQFSTQLEDFLHSFDELMQEETASDTLEITFNASVLGPEREVTITIKELAAAREKIDYIANWTLKGWKIAVMLFISSCCAKTLISSKGELVGLHE